MKHLGFTDITLGAKLGVPRETVYRWRMQHHRLNPDKIDILAEALDIDSLDLWVHPDVKSAAQKLESLPEQAKREAMDFVEYLLQKHRPPEPPKTAH